MVVLSCLSILFFCVVGVSFHQAAKSLSVDQYREKGFLRPPSGWEWFPFLFLKHYAFLENSRVRLFFAIAHFCLLGTIFSFLAAFILIGSELWVTQPPRIP